MSGEPCCPRNLCLLPCLTMAVFDLLGPHLPHLMFAEIWCHRETLSSNQFILSCMLSAIDKYPQPKRSYSRNYLLTCRKHPLFFSDYLKQWGSAWCQPPMVLLPIFPICWTFILHLFHSHFSSIMEIFYLTMLLVQFLLLCNFTWMFPILSRIYFYRSFALCCFPFVSLVYSGQWKSKTDRFCYSLWLMLQNDLFRGKNSARIKMPKIHTLIRKQHLNARYWGISHWFCALNQKDSSELSKYSR